ncbi:MAG: hypothetical protein J6T82_03550 [Bacteroidaceae bacterium]|nr:hypothetical protein [Bacteroidaceae bacterium]
MKTLIPYTWAAALLMVGLMVCTQANGQTRKQKIRAAIERQRTDYPKSELQDLYKSFFQDRFGPGHIIADTTSAGSYLRQEMATAKRFEGAYYEPTGFEGNLLRVNLRVLHEGLIDYDTFFSAFVRSVNSIKPYTVKKWKKEWRLIRQVIGDMGLENLPHFAVQEAQINAVLEKGEYQMDHSDTYSEAYDPHYRIVERRIFERELLPLIERR